MQVRLTWLLTGKDEPLLPVPQSSEEKAEVWRGGDSLVWGHCSYPRDQDSSSRVWLDLARPQPHQAKPRGPREGAFGSERPVTFVTFVTFAGRAAEQRARPLGGAEPA